MNETLSTTLGFRYTRTNRLPRGSEGQSSIKTEQTEQGMKLSKVRIGEKFVFDDRGGVWEKVADGKARCFFGSREMWNKEIDIPAEGYCYIPNFDPRCKGPNEVVSTPVSSVRLAQGTRVRIIDDENTCLVKEIENASASQVAALGASKVLRLTPPGKSKLREYSVNECRCDMEDGTFYVMVTPEAFEDEDQSRND